MSRAAPARGDPGRLKVTAMLAAHSIGYVAFRAPPEETSPSPRQPAAARVPRLTKRRAVDFCRVATALCPAVQA